MTLPRLSPILVLLTLMLWASGSTALALPSCTNCVTYGDPCALRNKGLRGTVRDSASSAPIGGATLTLAEGPSTTSAADGSFLLAADINTTCAQTFDMEVTVSAPGYRTNVVSGSFRANQFPFNFPVFLDLNVVATVTPTPTNTSTPFVLTNTPTPSPTPNVTATPTMPRPQIILAGYWNTRLNQGNPDNTVTVVALPNLAFASYVQRVEFFTAPRSNFPPRPLRIRVYDDGQEGDAVASDSVYMRNFPASTFSNLNMGLYGMRTINFDQYASGDQWPFLIVKD